MSAPGNFDFSRAVREHCFVQLRLVELRQMRDLAKSRGLENFGPVSRDPWEALDREGILVPVAYAHHGSWQYDQARSLEAGELIIREESGHIPWVTLQEAADLIDGADASPQILYHHWQILWLADLQARLSPGVYWGGLDSGLGSFLEIQTKAAAGRSAEKMLEALTQEAAERRAVELLLVRVQNFFFPFERGGPGQTNWIGGPVAGLTDDAAEWAMAELRNADLDGLAADCGTDVDDLRRIYEDLEVKARWSDPNARIFDLIDQINRSGLEALRGAARLARDRYDAARILRAWHAGLEGSTQLPDVGERRRLRRGGEENPPRRGDRSLLPELLEEYGLYPWRVQLLGEGNSEVVALRTIIEEGYGLSFEALGVAAADLGGADIPDNAELLLSIFRGYANYFLLVFDDEGRARQLIEALVRAEVIEGIDDQRRQQIREEGMKVARLLDDPETRREAMKTALARARDLSQKPGDSPEFLLWGDNFEADNFTPSELCQVLCQFAAEVGLEDFELRGVELEERLERERENGSKKAIASVALELASERHAGFRLSKPEFARRLARLVLAEHERTGEGRPILDLAEHLVSLTWASRRLQGGLRG